MNKKVNIPTEGAYIWVECPGAFLIYICRMLRAKKKVGKCVDLIEFLEANHNALEEFIKTRIPPLNWLLLLSELKAGRKILRLFDLPSNRKILLELGQDLKEDNEFLLTPNIEVEEEMFVLRKD